MRLQMRRKALEVNLFFCRDRMSPLDGNERTDGVYPAKTLS